MTRSAEPGRTGAGSMADELLELVAELLEEDPSEIPATANLFEMGLQSIALMHLVSRWREQGYEISFAMLAQAPTLEAWRRLLATAQRGDPAAPVRSHGESEEAGEPEESEDFELALLQHAYWVGRDSRQRLGGVAPHLYIEFDGTGVEPARLEAAFDLLVRRHEMLRVRVGDNGQQRIGPPVPWRQLRVHDLRASSVADAERQLSLIRDEMSHELLDIEHGEVFRAALSLLPEQMPGRGAAATRLHLDVDMVAADAVSYRVILADLARFYADPESGPAPLSYRYRDYLRARPEAHRKAKNRAAEYWRARLPELPGPPELPVAREPGEQAHTVRLALTLDAPERAALTGAARKRGVTPAAAVVTAFAEVVGAWSAQPRFLINVPMFDREPVHPKIDQVVGDFTSSVLLEVDLSQPCTFLERARRVQHRLHTDAAHKDYSGVEVLRDLSRRSGEQVIAPVVFTSGLDLGELFTELARRCFGDPVWILSQGPQVMLDAQISEIDGGLLVNWDVWENEFADGVPAAMFAAFEQLVRAMMGDEVWDAPVGGLLPADQRATRLRVNRTAAAGDGALLHQRFFEGSGERTGQPAVCWAGGGTMSHDQLADRALRVAAGLRERGVRPGDPVAVTLPRGPEQVLAVLGVLAAGATYVPVGVEQPQARAERIASVAGYRLVITADSGGASRGGVSRVPLRELVEGDPLPGPIAVSAGQPAYLLFTSGSTGEPKGVEVPHRAAMNTINDLIDRFRLGAGDRTLAVSALDFDLSVFDIFAMLDSGGAVVTLTEGQHRDAHHWVELIVEHGVTVLNCVPALLDAILRTELDLGGSLRHVLLGGDWVGVDLPGRLRVRAPRCTFAALGGTTETAIHSTICRVDEVPPSWRSVPYGTPLRNVTLRVVDHLGRDAPDWVPGELWIGGAGVALGYRGDPERTRDRFVTRDGTRWYRTGDIARYWPDGTVEFLGRRDNQVKINGFRVELGEVEAALLSVPGVKTAVAVIVTTGAGMNLAAGVVTGERPGGGARPDGDRIRAELARRLPPHMIPGTILGLDRVPLTANGKVDRAAVRRLAEESAAGPSPDEQAAPSTALERVITLIWRSVLQREDIGVNRSLFAVGGDSVLATVIVSQLREALDTDEVSVRMLFGTPTIAGLARNMLATATDPHRLETVAKIFLEVEAMSEDEVLHEMARLEGVDEPRGR